MNTHEYSSRPRLFVVINSLAFLTLLLAACGGPSTSGGAVTPTPGKTDTLQTSCPPAGKARAAIMARLYSASRIPLSTSKGNSNNNQPPTP
ncbi:MAG: hypothetical protein ACXWOX_18375 [Ktedonobacteraceae bacterium]